MGIKALLWLVILAGVVCIESKFMVYNTSQGIVPGKLNVHLVAHTHDDVGWLKTVDQYYVGSNNSIQGACVQNVLDSLVPALLADPNRKFIYVEQAFFQRWWRNQGEIIQNVVKQLLSSGQLEFINGGMCMHDEAATHYIDMIDQTTLGHRFIKEEFGIVPRIGWQIDPFGHSAVQAYLLGAELGFDSLFFGRIDYQDRAKRINEKSLEFVWQGSKSLGSSAQNGRVDALYSTPSIYTDAKYATDDSWTTKNDDFFLKRVVVHVRHHAVHVDVVLRHDHEGDVLCHHDEHVGDVLRHEHDEHVVDVLLRHDNALLLLLLLLLPHEDHDHDRRDAHRHHDNALLFRHVHVHRDVLRHDQVHVHVLHDVPHRGVEYDDDFRGETFSNVEESVEQSYSYYSGYNGSDKDPQNSGAYVFRPNGTFPIKPEGQVALTVLRGPVVEEVRQQINPWIYQTTRLHNGKEHAEVEFIVGPIPIDDGIGKEVATQITTSMVTNKTFYSDSNGRDFIKRIRDYRTDWDLEVNQPVAGNYYPINLGIYMQDNEKEFSILVDRSLGGSSIVDGQIELMLHRRLLLDDSKGVAEALNETVCVLNKCIGLTIQGKFYFRFDPLGEGAKWRRTFGQEIYSPLLLAFAEQDGDNGMSSHVASFSGIDSSYSLPDNVALITLQELDDGKVLLRLAHLYEIGEDKNLSVMTSVELKKLFPGKKIGEVTETNLSANQERTEMEKKRLVWKVEGSSREENKVVRGGPVDPAKLVVELAPMEIRTFVIDFNPESLRYVFDA
nr:putative alpha-mannosidase [Quercus suber]